MRAMAWRRPGPYLPNSKAMPGVFGPAEGSRIASMERTPEDPAMIIDMTDPRWTAVTHRDKSADGSFYYAVATTGVYCRPSCAARPARRENVSFHPTCEAAEAAGFRACKRCRPNEPSL